MLPLTLFSFPKRHNSTAVPTLPGAAVNVSLKQQTSLNDPVFILAGEKPAATYAQFEGAYYFIDDIVSIRNDLWEIHCSIDVLATYRNLIHNTVSYIEYAKDGNNKIVDQRLGVEYGTRGLNVSTGAGPVPYLDVDINDVSKYITCVGSTSTETFCISDSALSVLFSQIQSWASDVIDASGDILTVLATGLQQLIGSGNASQCIRDAYCLPIVAPTGTLAGAERLYLGMFDTRVSVNRIVGAGNVEKTINIAIPHQYSDWRRQNPYEICQLYLPLYGVINIPSDMAAVTDVLKITCTLNVRSGDFTYYVSSNRDANREIVVGGNCSAPIAIGASNLTAMNIVQTGLQAGVAAVASAAAGNAAGAAIGAALSLTNIQPAPYSAGQVGGVSNRYPHAECYVYYRTLSEDPAAIADVQGIPVFSKKKIGDLSGYVKTKDFSISGDIRGQLKTMINDFMDSGVFIE